MKYYNTDNPLNTVDFRKAVTGCGGNMGGLYLPVNFPTLPQAFINNTPEMTLREIAYVTCNLFLGSEVPPEALKQIVDYAYPLELPMSGIASEKYVLELFHGESLSYKDIGVRFLSALLQYFGRSIGRKVNVLVASTGNTASAVVNAFAHVEDLQAFVITPRSSLYNLTLPPYHGEMNNIHLVGADGNIDECKNMISSALADSQLCDLALMTSANSVNIARIIAQTALFIYAYSRLRKYHLNADVAAYSLPSGNLSMLTAGIFAKRMGLKCSWLIAACNANNIFDNYLKTGVILKRPPVATAAHFMDTAMPSNLARIKALYHDDINAMRRDVISTTVGDNMIEDTIFHTMQSCAYIADPHTAVGIAALESMPVQNIPAVVFATAHPQRSSVYIERVTGKKIEQKTASNRFEIKAWHPTILPPTYPALRKFILSHQ